MEWNEVATWKKHGCEHSFQGNHVEQIFLAKLIENSFFNNCYVYKTNKKYLDIGTKLVRTSKLLEIFLIKLLGESICFFETDSEIIETSY